MLVLEVIASLGLWLLVFGAVVHLFDQAAPLWRWGKRQQEDEVDDWDGRGFALLLFLLVAVCVLCRWLGGHDGR